MGSNYLITPNGDFVSENELYHHGILGMKWGVRRYQNEDGSLTAAGRRRYIGSDGNLTKAGKKYYSKETERLKKEHKTLIAQKRTEAKLSKLEQSRNENNSLKGKIGDKKNPSKSTDSNKKTLKDMTDDEIRKAIDRKRLEDDYRRVYPNPPSKTEKLGKFMNKFMDEAIIPATVNAGKNALNKWAEGVLKTKVDPNSYEALKKEYDKLKIKKDIADLKSGKQADEEPPVKTWDDLTKREQYKKAKRENDEAASKANAAQATDKSKSNSSTDPGTNTNSAKGSEKKEANNSANSSGTNQTSRTSKQEKKKKNNNQKQTDSSSTVYEGTVEGVGNNSWKGWGSSNSKSSSNTRRGSSVVDAREDEPVSSFTNSGTTSAGRSAVSGYLDRPIAGLLPAPKDRDY